MKILVASHKPYPMPANPIYQPILVGAAQHEAVPAGFFADDQGKNISTLNPHFNELTALYWAKYQLKTEDVVGLAHYRRFLGQRASHHYQDLLTEQDIRHGLSQADILLPKERHYYIESQESHYQNAHLKAPFMVMREVIKTDYPEFAPSFEKMATSSHAHLFNMSIMPQTYFQDYTDFLFGVLMGVKRQIPYEDYSGQDARVFGFLGERLLDPWLYTRGLSFKEYPLVTTEKTNWFKKGSAFLGRKFVKNGRQATHF
ncbi:DUF4422 domain-containing protein [Weissella halotolerans]|nr:DUF4422 domain-containing protein [Weissella halotolerans]